MSEALWLESYPWFLSDLLSLIWSLQPSPLTISSTLYRHPASHYYCWYLCSTSNLWSSFFTWFLREIIGCSSDCFARLFYGDWLPWMIWCRREGCPDLLDYCNFVEHLWSKSLEFVINWCYFCHPMRLSSSNKGGCSRFYFVPFCPRHRLQALYDRGSERLQLGLGSFRTQSCYDALQPWLWKSLHYSEGTVEIAWPVNYWSELVFLLEL